MEGQRKKEEEEAGDLKKQINLKSNIKIHLNGENNRKRQQNHSLS